MYLTHGIDLAILRMWGHWCGLLTTWNINLSAIQINLYVCMYIGNKEEQTRSMYMIVKA